MKKIFFFLIIWQLLVGLSHAWEYRIFGINPADFKDRKVTHIIVGAVASFAVHEAGHYFIGRAVGMDTSFRWDNSNTIGLMAWAEKYDDKSKSQKFLYHAGGFISQAVIGTMLTVAGNTRHSDFTLGFNSFTMVNSALYTATGGFDESDIENLDNLGYNGNAIGITSSVYSGVLSYVNLRKSLKKDGVPYFVWTPYKRERY